MSASLQDAYNDQITLEFTSAYAYLQMAAFFAAAAAVPGRGEVTSKTERRSDAPDRRQNHRRP